MAEVELSILLRLKDEATSALKSVQSNIKDFEQSFKSIGIAAGVAGAAITGFAVLAIKSFAETGEELNRLNLMTGISVKTLSVLKYMAESTGGSLSDIKTAFRGMATAIGGARDEQIKYSESLKAIGEATKEAWVDAYKEAEEQTESLKNRKSELAKEISSISARLDIANQRWKETNKKMEEAGDKSKITESNLMSQQLTISELSDRLAELTNEYDNMGDEVSVVTPKVKLSTVELGNNSKALRELGLSFKDLEALNPEDQFMTLALALSKVENATTRASLAQDIFGRSGMSLIPIFAQGAEGIKQMVDDAHRLGVVFDTDLTQKSLAVNKSIQDMKFGMQGLQIAIATALSPAIVNLATNVINLLTGFAQFVRDHPGVVQAIGAIGVALTILAGTLIAAATAMAILQALAGPVGWAALAVGAAIAAAAVAGIYFLTKTPEIPAMQSGGIVTRPTLAMIGESGPEAVVPLSRGQGGLGYNVTVNVEGSVISDRDLVAYIRSELLMIKDRNYSTGIA